MVIICGFLKFSVRRTVFFSIVQLRKNVKKRQVLRKELENLSRWLDVSVSGLEKEAAKLSLAKTTRNRIEQLITDYEAAALHPFVPPFIPTVKPQSGSVTQPPSNVAGPRQRLFFSIHDWQALYYVLRKRTTTTICHFWYMRSFIERDLVHSFSKRLTVLSKPVPGFHLSKRFNYPLSGMLEGNNAWWVDISKVTPKNKQWSMQCLPDFCCSSDLVKWDKTSMHGQKETTQALLFRQTVHTISFNAKAVI